MKRSERSKSLKILKKNIIAGLVLIGLVSLSLTGATFAWFTAEAETPLNYFTAGTVNLSQPAGIVTPISNITKAIEDDDTDQAKISPAEFVYGEEGLITEQTENRSSSDYTYGGDELIVGNPGEISPVSDVYGDGKDDTISLKTVAPTCKKVTWSFNNTGSKDAYVRVRPRVDSTQVIYIAVHLEFKKETAFVGVDNNKLDLPGHNFGQYLAYPLGTYTESQPLELGIWAGNNLMNFGSAKIWDDGTELFLELQTSQSRKIKDVHVYAGLEKPEHIGGFGNMGYKIPSEDYPFSPSTIFNFRTSSIFSTFPPQDQALPDVLLNSLYGGLVNADISICPESEEYWQEKDGWWYYGSASAPTNVIKNGGEVTVCFRYCYLHSSEELTFHLEAQAVQSSHGAYTVIWKDVHPW
jgi:predicted ribosomally synthesized peptide with SipW-like signal peptide